MEGQMCAIEEPMKYSSTMGLNRFVYRAIYYAISSLPSLSRPKSIALCYTSIS